MSNGPEEVHQICESALGASDGPERSMSLMAPRANRVKVVALCVAQSALRNTMRKTAILGRSSMGIDSDAYRSALSSAVQ